MPPAAANTGPSIPLGVTAGVPEGVGSRRPSRGPAATVMPLPPLRRLPTEITVLAGVLHSHSTAAADRKAAASGGIRSVLMAAWSAAVSWVLPMLPRCFRQLSSRSTCCSAIQEALAECKATLHTRLPMAAGGSFADPSAAAAAAVEASVGCCGCPAAATATFTTNSATPLQTRKIRGKQQTNNAGSAAGADRVASSEDHSNAQLLSSLQ
jgi:hypothetical protein